MKDVPHLPKHVAFIMDGNGRWAKQRGLSRIKGHQAGVEKARSVVDWLHQRQVGCVTLYAFSTENWRRPKSEVTGLFGLLKKAIDKEALGLHKKGIKICHIGHQEELTASLRQSINRTLELTRDNTAMVVNLAFNYGGRREILDAVSRLISEGVPPREIDEELFSARLYTAGLPDVDLVIRTGGEIRISNFLLWQAAYSEYYFTPVLWPDFGEEELDQALLAYSQRQRRFGRLQSKAACSEKG
ncbi:MAG: polyprenyl diphosphate synthase [Chloroflexota bacterium]